MKEPKKNIIDLKNSEVIGVRCATSFVIHKAMHAFVAHGRKVSVGGGVVSRILRGNENNHADRHVFGW